MDKWQHKSDYKEKVLNEDFIDIFNPKTQKIERLNLNDFTQSYLDTKLTPTNVYNESPFSLLDDQINKKITLENLEADNSDYDNQLKALFNKMEDIREERARAKQGQK